MNMLTNKIHGYGQDGKPIQHEQLPGVIASEQAFRDQFSKNGGSPAQLNALDNRIAVLKANSNAMDKHAASVLDTSEAIKAKYAEQKQDNAASNKPQKPAQVVLALNPNGGSDVLNSDDAAQQGLKVTTPLKAGDVQKLNGTVAGFNDVQTKINKLADIVNSGDFASVQPGIAQAMIEKGLSVDSHGVSIPFGRINAALNAENAKVANPATRKFVVAWLGTHEAVTQLPRLQTFGTSNRMTEKQMEAAQQMLPQAGDDPSLAQEKLSQFQDVLDPLRKQVPRMPGAALLPSFRERQTNQQAPSKGGSNLGRTVLGGGNVNDYINSFVPSN
jgi:hypothetical protein